MSSLEPLLGLLAAIVRGDVSETPLLGTISVEPFLDEAEYQGVLPLVSERLATYPDAPAALAAAARARTNAAVANDLVREMELRHALAALDAAGMGALLIKGSHLAYSHYPRPDLRPRIDTDILIPVAARGAVQELLTRLGYESSSKVSGELVTGQSMHVKRVAGRPIHAFDVHWKLATPLVFGNVLSYDDLAATAVGLPALGVGARAPDDVHALLIACIHRVAHHLDDVRLKWLYDIDLLARTMDRSQWQTFATLAADRQVAAVCRRSLERATEFLGTRVPTNVLEGLRAAEAGTVEMTAEYLTLRPQAKELVDDLRTLRHWSDRLRLVREHVFPPSQYMRRVYAPSSAMPLPVLYVWRVVRGARKWLSH